MQSFSTQHTFFGNEKDEEVVENIDDIKHVISTYDTPEVSMLTQNRDNGILSLSESGLMLQSETSSCILNLMYNS